MEHCIEEYLGVGFLNIFTSVDPSAKRGRFIIFLRGRYQNRHPTMVPSPVFHDCLEFSVPIFVFRNSHQGSYKLADCGWQG